MGKLSALAIKAATKPGTYQDGDGLMLVVKATGSRSWILRAQVDGKRRDFGLGPASSVALAKAREKAEDIRRQLREGIDPVAKKRADKLAKATIPTFRVAADDCHGERRSDCLGKRCNVAGRGEGAGFADNFPCCPHIEGRHR